MCEQEGIRFEETLTGFKWLGNKALDLEADGYKVLFAYEEAIGFMLGGTSVVDKDGVAAAAVFVDLVNHVYGRELSLQAHLEGLYAKYGERLYKQGYFVIDVSKCAEVLGVHPLPVPHQLRHGGPSRDALRPLARAML